ncbi:UNVERIFIED_CONTAM: hypothetical protein O8I53_09580 [Campylobacter lari]
MKKLDLAILEESLVYKRLKAMQTFTDNAFKEISAQFFNHLEEKSKALRTKLNELNKEHAKTLINKNSNADNLSFLKAEITKTSNSLNELSKNISIYKNKVSSKLNTLKSFKFEVKYLLRDVNTIYLLLGVNRSKNPVVR